MHAAHILYSEHLRQWRNACPFVFGSEDSCFLSKNFLVVKYITKFTIEAILVLVQWYKYIHIAAILLSIHLVKLKLLPIK